MPGTHAIHFLGFRPFNLYNRWSSKKERFTLTVKIIAVFHPASGMLLVTVGFFILIHVIPKAGKRYKDSESRTEFYSVSGGGVLVGSGRVSSCLLYPRLAWLLTMR